MSNGRKGDAGLSAKNMPTWIEKTWQEVWNDGRETQEAGYPRDFKILGMNKKHPGVRRGVSFYCD